MPASLGCDAGGSRTSTNWSFAVEWDGQTYTQDVMVPDATRYPAPWPLVMYFHGFMGTTMTPGPKTFAEKAHDVGVATVRLQGAGPPDMQSWNGFGSTRSPGPDGPTCAPGSPSFCFEDCGECGDECWWTTCIDSVGLAMKTLDAVEQELCVDLDRVWAAGCSNGGMFAYELAKDVRSAPRLAGIAPVVGLPHNGFNIPPASPMHMVGVWGSLDATCPPFSNTDDPTKSLDSSYGGWYYSTAANTTRTWARANGCTMGEEPGVGCVDVGTDCASGDVRGCVFDTEHVCRESFQHSAVLEFILPRTKPPIFLRDHDDIDDDGTSRRDARGGALLVSASLLFAFLALLSFAGRLLLRRRRFVLETKRYPSSQTFDNHRKSPMLLLSPTEYELVDNAINDKPRISPRRRGDNLDVAPADVAFV